MLKLDGISKSFNEVLFDNATFEFKTGKVYFILGESGIGKTTLLNVIRGIEPLESGLIIYDGKILNELSYEEKKNFSTNYISYVKQDSNLFENLTVMGNLKIITDNEVLINKLIKVVDLEYCKDDYVKKLSGGEKRRVSILRTVLLNTSILLFDEPTSNVDYETAQQIMNLISSISSEKVVIVVSHDADICNEFANEIITIDNGKFKSMENLLSSKKTTEICFLDEKNTFKNRFKLNNKPFFIDVKFALISVLFAIVFCFFILLSGILKNSFYEFYVDEYSHQVITFDNLHGGNSINESQEYVDRIDNIVSFEKGIPIVTNTDHPAFRTAYGLSDDIYLEDTHFIINDMYYKDGSVVPDVKTLFIKENSYMYGLGDEFSPIIENMLIAGSMPVNDNEVVINLEAAYYNAVNATLDVTVIEYTPNEILNLLQQNNYSFSTFYKYSDIGDSIDEDYHIMKIVGIVNDSSIENNNNEKGFKIDGWNYQDERYFSDGVEIFSNEYYTLGDYEFKYHSNVYFTSVQYDSLYYSHISLVEDIGIDDTEDLDDINYNERIINTFILKDTTDEDYFNTLDKISLYSGRLGGFSFPFSSDINMTYNAAYLHDYPLLVNALDSSFLIILIVTFLYVLVMVFGFILLNKSMNKDIEGYKELNFTEKYIYKLYIVRFAVYQFIILLLLLGLTLLSILKVFKLLAIPYDNIFYFTVLPYSTNFLFIFLIVLGISILNILFYSLIIYKHIVFPKKELYLCNDTSSSI